MTTPASYSKETFNKIYKKGLGSEEVNIVPYQRTELEKSTIRLAYCTKNFKKLVNVKSNWGNYEFPPANEGRITTFNKHQFKIQSKKASGKPIFVKKEQPAKKADSIFTKIYDSLFSKETPKNKSLQKDVIDLNSLH